MEIKKIEYLIPPTDPVNECLDVFVTLEDNSSYFVEVTTPQYLSACMKKIKSNFIPPYWPVIIVSKLTDDIIKESIQSFINKEDDSYWLKLYHIIPSLKIEEINEILDRKKKQNLEIDAKVDAEIEAESTTND